MKLTHDKTREILPEYLRDSLSEELKRGVKAHLKNCRECKEEASFLSELVKLDAPPPEAGDLFYKTLPQRVRGALRDKSESRFSLRPIFFRPILAAAAAAFIAIIIFTVARNWKKKDFDPFFKDPFTISVLDYSGISERDIISKDMAIDERYIHEDFMGYSYIREFAYLNKTEIDGLNEALNKEQKTGG